MHNRLLELLKPLSVAGLVHFIETQETQFTEGEEQKKNIADRLAGRLSYKKIKPIDLLEIEKDCLKNLPVSPRILLCASKDQITDLQPYDTIISPDGVWQIGDDFQEQAILSKKEMSAAIDSSLIPTKQTPFTIYKSNDTLAEESDAETPDLGRILSHALNNAMREKNNAFYLAQETSASLAKTDDVILELKKIILTEINYRKMQSFFLKLNKLNTESQLFRLAEKFAKQLFREKTKQNSQYGGDEFTDYMSRILPKTINFQTLSESDLQILSLLVSCSDMPYSSKIISAGSTDLLDTSAISKYDTILLPDRVLQINEDSQGVTVLDAAETRKIPKDLLPKPDSEQTVLEGQKYILLSQHLNPAIVDKKGAYYISIKAQEAAYNLTSLLGAISTLAEEELHRRALRQNLIHKLLSFKTDFEFLQYYWNYMHTPPVQDSDGDNFEKFTNYINQLQSERDSIATQNESENPVKSSLSLQEIKKLTKKHGVSAFQRYLEKDPSVLNSDPISFEKLKTVMTEFKAWVFKQHIQSKLSHRIELNQLSNQQLQTLIRQCDMWRPLTSPRIICSQQLPDSYQIGDTLILAEGIYQMRLNSHGIIKKELIMDRKTMDTLGLNTFIPSHRTETIIYEDFNKKEDAELSSLLNTHIAKHPKGMYLCSTPSRATEGFGMVNILLKQTAQDILKARLLQSYQTKPPAKSFFSKFSFSIFGSGSKQIAPEPLEQATTTQTKSTIKTLRKQAKGILALKENPNALEKRVRPSASTLLMTSEQSENPLEESVPSQDQHSIQEIINELDLRLQQTHTAQTNSADDSVKIMQHQETLMEIGKRSVAVYKPLLKATEMKDREKAELFLKSMGIPPTRGKHSVAVKGGHHGLRKAIRELFQEYKAIEAFQKTKQLGRTRSDTDTDLSSEDGMSPRK